MHIHSLTVAVSRSLFYVIGCSLILSFFAPAAMSQQQHITGITANATSYQANFYPTHVVSETGLSESAPGSNLVYFRSDAPQWNSNYGVIGGMNDDRPIIDFDLGASYTVNRFHVWNYNGGGYTWRGFKDVAVYYSQDAVTWKAVPQFFTFAPASGTNDYAGEDHTFIYPVTARYIRFIANSAHRTWSDVTGLGRVRFYAGGTPTTPPPATGVFPRDSGIVNVKEAPYFAKGDGAADDTVAIQRAINDHQGTSRTIYLPNGTYLVSNSLRYAPGIFYGRNNLRGESRSGTILRLANNTFTDPANPRAVLFLGFNGSETGGNVSADWFHNHVSDFTIDTGTGNTGAIGLQFYSNNTGAARDITIRSADRQGVRGLDLGFKDQNGPLLVKNVLVEGFDYGITTGNSVNSQTFEHIAVRNQRVLGFRNEGQCLAIRDFQSTNSVPAFHNVWGVVALIKATFKGTSGASAHAAIINGETLFARSINTSGYNLAIDNQYDILNATPDAQGPSVGEYVSSGVNSLFDSPPRSLNLPIVETPSVTTGDPNAWANVRSYRQLSDLDDTAAIQRAIDSGAATVYFPTGGTYYVSGTIYVRAAVRRVIGMHSSVVMYGNAAPGFRMENGTGFPSTVMFEKFRGNEKPLVTNVSSRTLVFRDSEGMINPTGTGRTFLENVVGGPFVFTRQNVWARQLNAENQGTKVLNDRGQLWILGLKTERGGTLIETRGGGKSELIGGLSYTTTDPAGAPMFVDQGSSMSATIGEVTYSGTPFTTLISETRSGETRTLARGEGLLRWSFLGGSAVPLYTGYGYAQVQPTLQCVVANSDNTFTARFGYRNANSVGVTIPVGASNTFAPGDANRGQITWFQSGTVANAFSVTFDGSNLTWSVKGPDAVVRTASASSASSPRCQ